MVMSASYRYLWLSRSLYKGIRLAAAKSPGGTGEPVLWHGGTIVVGQAVEIPGPGVDTEQDFAKVGQILRQAR